MIGGAFARSRVLMAAKERHPLAMAKWWKKKRPVEAEVNIFIIANALVPVVLVCC